MKTSFPSNNKYYSSEKTSLSSWISCRPTRLLWSPDCKESLFCDKRLETPIMNCKLWKKKEMGEKYVVYFIYVYETFTGVFSLYLTWVSPTSTNTFMYKYLYVHVHCLQYIHLHSLSLSLSFSFYSHYKAINLFTLKIIPKISP